jgi:hypothetical protein
MRCGCLASLVPIGLVAALVLVLGSSLRVLPDTLAGAGAYLERGAAGFLVAGDAEAAGLEIRSIEPKTRTDGTIRLIVRARLLDAETKASAAAARLAPALADRTEGPLALARDVSELVIVIEDADRVALVTYRASAASLAKLRSTTSVDPGALLRFLEQLPDALTPAN